MLYDGINLLEGSTIANAAVAAGTTFPTLASVGELFYRSDEQRLYVYDGSAWDPVASGSSFDPAADRTITGNWLFTSPVSGVTPTTGSHLVTKTYVDNLVQGLSWKTAVRAATTANITLSGTQTIDGVALAAGDRVLVKDQTTASQNGVYVVAAGDWARAADMDGSPDVGEVNGAAVYISDGTTNGDTAWTQTATITTVGTQAMAFAQLSGGSEVPSDSPSFTTQMVLGSTGGPGASAFLIRAANTVSTTAGALTIRGSANSGVGGAFGGEVIIEGGPSTNGANPGGGNVIIRGGSASQSSGNITIATPNAGVTSGTITLSTGTGLGSNRGEIVLNARQVALTGGLIANGSTGTTGQALTINASGVPVWADVTANSVAAGTLTGTTMAANVVNSSLTSVGTITSGTWAATIGAVSGANLTNLNASNLGSGTVPVARLGTSGTPSSSTYLRGDNTWQPITGATSVSATVTGTNSADLLTGFMAGDDSFRLRIGATATNAGFVEIATADDGNEPIHVRQYTGAFASLIRTATLLDESGNTTFPGTLTSQGLVVSSGSTTAHFVRSTGNNTAALHLQNLTSGNTATDGSRLMLESSGVDVSLWNAENGYVRFATNGTERFRILAGGAWSVGTDGTSTGTSGQVLTSNGSGSSPTWQAPSQPLTSTQIGYGNGSNILTGTATLTWDNTARALQLGSTGTTVSGTIRTPSSTTSGSPSHLTIRAGDGAAGTTGGGNVTLQGGTGPGSGSEGGDIILTGGVVSAGSGQAGRLLLSAGTGGVAGWFQLTTGGTERLRILANGAWSVGSNGTSTGTSGQVLTSTGAGSAPTWQTLSATPTQVPRSTTFNGTTADRGNRIVLTAGVTLPSGVYSGGDAFSFYNSTASPVTITQGSGLTLRQDGTANTGNRTLAAYGTCFVWYNTASEAVISGSLT